MDNWVEMHAEAEEEEMKFWPFNKGASQKQRGGEFDFNLEFDISPFFSL